MRGGFLTSMFHRRLLLIGAVVVAGFALLSAQLTRLTVVRGEEMRREAEARLISERWIPTERGRILDREGRVLAVDRPSFDIAVEYNLINGSWAYSEAANEARRQHRDRWGELSPPARDRLIRRYLPAHQQRLEAMWEQFAQTAGVQRAEIDRRRRKIVRQVQRMAATVWERRRVAREAELSRDRERRVEVDLADVSRPIREQVEPHVVLRAVDDRTAFDFRRLAGRFPGLRVRDAGDRAYPFEMTQVSLDLSTFPGPLRRDGSRPVTVRGAATHLVGWMRDSVQKEDIERRREKFGEKPEDDRGHYQPGDSVGAAGLEQAFEDDLRGLRGREVTHLDSGRREVIKPTPGEDVRLTLDIDLQARVQALLKPELGLTRVQPWHGNDTVKVGEPLAAAAVALDVETGEALALAGHPTFTRRQLRKEPETIFGDPVMAPWINRAIGRPYAPGSIVKPLVLAEAVTGGAHRLDRRIECNGHLLPDRKDVYRCWIWRDRYGYTTHTAQVGGPLGARQAIARSCNIYFYTLGRAMGVERVRRMYERLGVGRGFGAHAPGASPGFLGHNDGSRLYLNDAIMMAIGQGPVSWTPLHAANAYATLARGGVMIQPRVVKTEGQSQRADFGWDQSAIDAALEGLRLAVNESYGTGHHITVGDEREPIFNASGVRVIGKTGTAQGAPIMAGQDDAGSNGGSAPARRGDHAWTLALVGEQGEPLRYAVAVIVEFGGSGGRAAGPIANQIVHALIDEGYLSGAGER